MIDCVSIATSHNFTENLLVEQHRLRYQEVIQKEQWRDIYVVDGMEFDQYDNLATEYYVARNHEGKVIGVTRSYPTTIPYMLSDVFPYLSSKQLPSDPNILEASRLVLDRSLLTKEQRRGVINRLVMAYMLRGLQRQIDAYIGFMLPKIWGSTFQRAGWDIEWLGPEVPLPNSTDIVRAALMPVNKSTYRKVRQTTGIQTNILNFGLGKENPISIARYSHTKEQKKEIAA